MTEETMFFDTDCISAFLWIDNTSIITALYGTKVAIPMQVYDELQNCRGQAAVLKTRIEKMISAGKAVLIDMDTTGKEYELYLSLAINPEGDKVLIGKGEAACIALARERQGILASNNLKDISRYIDEYKLKHKTTGEILIDAYEQKLLTTEQIEEIWSDMLAKKRKIGARSFSEYLKNANNQER